MPTTSASHSYCLRCRTDALTFSSFVLTKGGFAIEHYFEDAVNRFQNASGDPETFKILEESKFRKLYPRRVPRNKKDVEEELEGEEDPNEVFDQGGRPPIDR